MGVSLTETDSDMHALNYSDFSDVCSNMSEVAPASQVDCLTRQAAYRIPAV